MFRSEFRVPSSRFDVGAGNRKRQRGAVLFIALIVLVAMTLAGIAIMRSVDTTTLIAGNIAFKQGTIQSADDGIERAYQWLLANRAGLANSNTGQGYYSALASPDWNNPATWQDTPTLGPDAAGNTMSYLIHRMCNCANTGYSGNCTSGVSNQCAVDNPAAATTPAPAQGDSYAIGRDIYQQDQKVYYRITVLTRGPRNTAGIVQAMVAIAL
jgi:type IV pilus assembly protein PilX